MFSIKRGANGVWYGTFGILDRLKIKHGISTRLGGVSQPPFASLNLGLKTGDDLQAVKRNRELFCEAVGVPFAAMVSAQQVHATDIHITGKEDRGRGADCHDTAVPATDALITAEPGVPLMLFFADCVPVLLYDPIKQVVAVSHAGWKGTVGKIAQKTVLAMQDRFGSRPENCIAAIGPSIGPESYEVDELVIEALQAAFPWWREVVTPHQDRWLLDLWRTNRRQLEDVGVKADNIAVSGVCTELNMPLFYSHRGEEGLAGRMGAVIML